MEFTESQRNFIKSEYEKSLDDEKGAKYHLVYKPNNEYSSTWSLAYGNISSILWNWDNYEFRLLKFMDRPILKSEIEDVFVYVYNGMVYYNDPNNELHMTYINGMDENNSFSTSMTANSEFRVLGSNMVVGSSDSYDSVLRIVGVTDLNQSIIESYLMGPKLQFQVGEDRTDGWVAVVYSDKRETDDKKIFRQPFLKLNSKGLNEVFIIPRKKTNNLTVSSRKSTSEIIENANIKNLSATITFKNIQTICKVFFPIGCFYWTSDQDFEPSEHFGGNWERVTDTFIYASSFADGDVHTRNYGAANHTISISELPIHSHNVVDGGHTHELHVGIHTHDVRDPGHIHKIRTIGDDYNGSYWWTQRNTGNFAGDGHNDMTNENANRGIGCTMSKTGISMYNASTGVKLLSSGTNCVCEPFIGGGRDHNNMPPYIRAFCWHRVS